MTHTYYPPVEGDEQIRIEVSLKKLGLPVMLKNLSTQCFKRKVGSKDWIATPVCPAQQAEIAKQQCLLNYQ